jgi:hypothetical protein
MDSRQSFLGVPDFSYSRPCHRQTPARTEPAGHCLGLAFLLSNLPFAAVGRWPLTYPSSLTHCANFAHDKPLFFKCDALPTIFKSLRESGGGHCSLSSQ